MSKLKQLAQWIETEAVIVEQASQHRLEDLKTVFVNGLLSLRDYQHQQAQSQLAEKFGASIVVKPDPNQTELSIGTQTQPIETCPTTVSTGSGQASLIDPSTISSK